MVCTTGQAVLETLPSQILTNLPQDCAAKVSPPNDLKFAQDSTYTIDNLDSSFLYIGPLRKGECTVH